jgi:hypothetical protein
MTEPTSIVSALHDALADLARQEAAVRADHEAEQRGYPENMRYPAESVRDANGGYVLLPLLSARASALAALAGLGEGSEPGRGWHRLQIDVKPGEGWDPRRVDLHALADALTPIFGLGSFYDGARLTSS